ncbi:MAG: hypothetical protein HY975_04450 [Candidatus Kerfeldbacteria bacterium]|nr:hypothetical protein [Candidatus Kerfeldbacteria bacterium]
MHPRIHRWIIAVGVSTAFAFGWSSPAMARQSVVVQTTPVIVQEPELSRAYYAHLRGQPAVYEVTVNEDLTFYASLLVPATTPPPNDLQVEVLRTNELGAEILIAVIQPTATDWQPFRERLSGDNYWQGPSYRQDVGPGTYRLVVSSPTNTNTYVLAIGEQESWSASTFLGNLSVLPVIQSDIFGRAGWMFLFRGLVGTVVYYTIGFVVLLVALIAWRRHQALQHIIRQSDIVVEHREQTPRW